MIKNGMNFNGSVGEMGSMPSAQFYDLSYTGEDLKKLKAFVLKTCKQKGLEVTSLTEGMKDGRNCVTARVKSTRGIV